MIRGIVECNVGSVVAKRGRDRGVIKQGGRQSGRQGRSPICLLAMHKIIGILSNLSVIFIFCRELE